jgi:hypothetical protein
MSVLKKELIGEDLIESFHCTSEIVSTVILFIYNLVTDTDNSSDYIAPNVRIISENELGKLWKEAVIP